MAPIALIGANGFIGKRIGMLAVQRGTEVLGYTRATPIVNSQGLDPAVKDAAAVVWAASSITPAVAETHPERIEDEQRSFTAICEQLAELDSPPHLVVMSSGGTVYGGPDVPYRETDAPAPVNRYGEAKLELERIAARASLSSTVLRVANAYGVGQRNAGGQGVIGYWLRALREDHPIVIFGDGTSARDYVYVDDIARAVLLAADAPGAANGQRILNIGSGTPTTLTELAELCLEVTGHDSTIRYEASRGFDASKNYLDATAARETLGWSAETDLRTGIQRTWEWVNETALV